MCEIYSTYCSTFIPWTNVVIDFVSLLFGDVDAGSVKPILTTVATDIKSGEQKAAMKLRRGRLNTKKNLLPTFYHGPNKTDGNVDSVTDILKNSSLDDMRNDFFQPSWPSISRLTANCRKACDRSSRVRFGPFACRRRTRSLS